jgi:hypothetical protein
MAMPTTGSSQSSSLLSNCTATVVSGKFWIQSTTSNTWQEGTNGMVLAAGSVIRTDTESQVILTFFEGSTIKLEPNTAIKIEQLNNKVEGYSTVLLQQFFGRTWSLVVKMTDIRSRYEIQTPAANAMVRGTSFLVEVGDHGLTSVGVAEGVVVVAAQGAEVSVPAGFESTVNNGMRPVSPTQMDPGMMQQAPSRSPIMGNSTDNSNSSNSNAGGNGNGNGNSNAGGNGNGNGNSNAGGNGNGNGNSNAGGNSSNSNAGGNSSNSNAGGNSSNSNAGGNSSNSNAGGNSSNSNAGGNGNGKGK